MRRLAILGSVLLLGGVIGGCQPADTAEAGDMTATGESPIDGVWSNVRVDVTTPDSSFTIDIVRPSVLIYEDGHYAAVNIQGQEPREVLPDEATDAQLLAAVGRLRMNGGTFEVDGSTVTGQVITHWNPNAMAEGPTNSFEYEVEGDVLRRTFTNEENGTQFVVISERRAEAPPSEVDGVWDDVQVEVTNPDTSFTNPVPSPAVIIFSRGHYVITRVAGAEPRELWPEEGPPSDEQRLAGMRRLRGEGGTFTLEDGNLVTRPMVHRIPNVVQEGQTATRAYEVSGDTMTWVFTNEEAGSQTRVTFRRRG